MAGAGYKLFVSGDVLTAAQVNNYLNEQTVMVFATSAARTSALSAVLAEGMMSYLQDSNTVFYYDGAAWNALASGDLTAITAGNGISVTSGTGPVPTVLIDTAVTVDKTTAQTLTNKTLTTPIISSISNTGTLTLPTSTDTLVGRATTDTLTNKTLTSPALTTPTISTLTTNGDLLYGTGSGALTRLGIGSSAQVLTVASGLPSWSTPAGGGLTLLSTTTFNNSVTNYTVSSISDSYKNLLIVGSNLQTANSAGPQPLVFQFNGDTGNNYNMSGIRNNAGTIQSYSDAAYSNYQVGGVLSTTASTSPQLGNFQMTVYNYASTSLYKVINSQGGCLSAAAVTCNTNSGNWQNNTTAITSIKFSEATASNLKTGTIQIYGVN